VILLKGFYGRKEQDRWITTDNIPLVVEVGSDLD